MQDEMKNSAQEARKDTAQGNVPQEERKARITQENGQSGCKELSRLFPPKAAALQNALIEWYKFNDCLQHLSGVMDDRDKDDCYTAGYYKRFFDESINAIHDTIARELARTLEDHALDTAF